MARLGRLLLAIAVLATPLALPLCQCAWAGDDVARGDRLLDEGRAAEALAIWEQARAERPGDTGLLVRIATAQARLGQLADAEATLLGAARLEPKSAKVRHNLALVYLKQKNSEKALATFHEVLRLEEGYPTSNYFIGLIHEVQGDEKTAETYYIREVNNGICMEAWDRLTALSEKRRAEGLGPQRPAPWKVVAFSCVVLALAGALYGLKLFLDARGEARPPGGYMPPPTFPPEGSSTVGMV